MPLATKTMFGFGLAGIGWILVLSVPWLAMWQAAATEPTTASEFATFAFHVGGNLIVSGFAIAIFSIVHDRNRGARASVGRGGDDRPTRIQAESTLAPQQPDVVARGRLADRDYTLFSDGSVEVETRLGNRRFCRLRDAKDFIGA